MLKHSKVINDNYTMMRTQIIKHIKESKSLNQIIERNKESKS